MNKSDDPISPIPQPQPLKPGPGSWYNKYGLGGLHFRSMIFNEVTDWGQKRIKERGDQRKVVLSLLYLSFQIIVSDKKYLKLKENLRFKYIFICKFDVETI